TVRVEVRVADKELRVLLEKGIRSTRIAEPGGARPELLFTDQSEPTVEGSTWVVQLVREKEAVAYAGPFVLDRTSPLTEGLSLRGVIWGAGKNEQTEGAPVVLTGNVPLLTDAEFRSDGGEARHLRWRFRPDLSTLQDSPDWPILLWNLLHWRA